MKNNYSSIDYDTGNVIWDGPLTAEKGNHECMPERTEAYLSGDERGHVNASSLGGNNTIANVVPQNYDLNHGAYYSMEQGERMVLKSEGAIHSTKIAIANGHNRPEVFMVTDEVTYADGHTEMIHHSFANASNVEQQLWNEQTAMMPETFEAPNPEAGLRCSMNPTEYMELMERTDMELPNIAEEYNPTVSANFTEIDNCDMAYDATVVTSDVDMDVAVDCDCGVDCDSDV